MATNPRSTDVRVGRYVQGGTTEQFPDRLGWWERRVIPSSDVDVLITIQPQYHKRPDKMAYDAYGRADEQWLILQYNNIVDINLEFITGKQIKLPVPSRVKNEILTQNVDITK